MVIRKINVSKIVQRRRSLAVVLLFSFFILLFLLCLSAFSTSPTTKASILIAHFNPVASMRSFLVDESSGEDLAAYTVSERSLRMAESYTASDWTSKLSSCDLFDGQWVVDDAYPIYKSISCPYVDKAFDCFKNGRPDSGFLKLRWRPRNCDIPRFNGTKMLQLLSGKRLVFVGDSLNRNMWESLICAVSKSLDDQKKVVQVSGKREFNTVGFYSFKFKDYNCSIDFIRSHFLVKELQRGSKSETLRIDMIDDKAEEYREADIIVFNSGHWWTHSETKKGKNFFQEGDHIYSSLPVNEAYLKAMRTWAKWVDANIDPDRTRVFFRGYSASHFKGGQWNSGGNCYGEKRPVANGADLAPYPWMMTRVAESVIAEIKEEQHRKVREDNEQLMKQHDKEFETLVQSEALSSPRPNQMHRRILMEVKQSPAPVTKHERKLPLNKLNIAVTVNVGFLNLEFINGHRNENKGYSVDVFKAAVDTLDPPLKFEYEFKYYPINNGSHDIDNLLGEVYKKKIDAVVGDTTISAARYYVDFTLPYSDPGIAMVVPRTSKLRFKQNFFIYLKPFAPELWGAIVGVVISTLLFLLLLHRIQNDNAQSLWQHLKTQMTSIFGNGDSPLDFRTILVVVIVGAIVTPMMVSVYAASFSSHIAYHQNEKVDLNSKDVYIGYQCGSIIVEDLLLRKLKIDGSRLKCYTSLKDYDTALSKGSAKGGVSAIIDETPYLKVFLAKHASTYKFDGRSYKSKGFAFAFPFDSPHASHVSKGITNIEENGKMEAIEWKHFGVPDYQENESSSAYQVQWIHFGGLFISMGFLFIIIFLSTSWVGVSVIMSFVWLVFTVRASLINCKLWLKARIQWVQGLFS